MSSEVLKKFGRYFLLDLIAQGGMAEIYRARLAAKDGAGRLVVVKRIQAGFGANDEFLKMFKSEIKVSMGLNHPNIVALYDFGEEQSQPFITMEFVDGKNLRQLLNRFKELGQPFPVELAAHIIEQSASGLHYAHAYKDKISGDPLNVVHRDISPQNLLISFEGGVKIIDFGIAKATTNNEHTRAGVIKGKPSYLSPEQISGDAIDGRTDLFALGAVFWELLVGRKLFSGDNDLAVLKMIESCTTTVRPPSESNPGVPKELDVIVMKMLSRSPDKRYQTGEELQRTLRKFMNVYAPDFVSSDLSYVSKELFQKEIVEDRKKVQRLNERVEQLLLNDIPEIAAHSEEKKEPRREDTTTFVSRRPPAGVQDFELKPSDVQNQAPLAIERPARPQGPRPAAPGTKQIHLSLGNNTPSANHYTRTGMSRQSNGYGQKESSKNFGIAGFAATLAIIGGISWIGPRLGFEVPILSALLGENVNRTVASRVEPTSDPGTVQSPAEGANAKTPPAKLRLNIFPEGKLGKISVNGNFIDPANPVVDVPTDSPLELLVQREGFEPFRSEFKVDSRSLGANGEYRKEINLEPEIDRAPAMIVQGDDFGYLSVKSTPGADVKIFVNGKFWGQKYAPFEMMKVPTGKLDIRFYNSTLDLEDKIQVDIDRKHPKQIQSNLKPRVH
ncbi:MAG: serine/threonine protein kinase [Cryobacterium sp.]|nr:serine/threonine protein kinase [Oligoflexia bacterium]